MIVKDEETFIANCLNSIKNVVDEMIIVDTGSQDSTVEICKSLGAKVFSYAWNDNFAEARNYGLEKATGDWIIWLDADEEVDQDSASKLRDILKEEKYHIAGIHLVNYYGSYPIHLDHAYLVHHHRLFRNKMGFRFRNEIHEQLNVQEVIGDIDHLPVLPVTVHHYGYLEDVTDKKNKNNRNMQILQKMKKTNPDNPWVDYHIASEYYRKHKYEKSFEYVNQALTKFIKKKQLPPSLVYKLKYEILIVLNSFEGAWPAIDKAIMMYPDYVDLHFYKGLIFIGLNKHKQAIEVFQHCLELGENNLRHLTLKGSGSFQAWYYIGICHQELGDDENAELAWEKCIELSPNHLLAKEALEKLKKPSL
jgi:glycosyltransferase involved in cell wall biosynthesis